MAATSKLRGAREPKSPSRERSARISKAAQAAMDESIDRYMERWIRKLLFVHDGVVRKFTEDEVQWLVKSSKSKAARARTAGKSQAPRGGKPQGRRKRAR